VKSAKLHQNRAWLRKKYVLDKMSIDEIAELAGVTSRTIYNKLKDYELLRKS
jgi:predicted DNA-binding protein YlxM (UPF0122 family)